MKLFHGGLARSSVLSSLHGSYREICESTWRLWKQNLLFIITHSRTDCISRLAFSTTYKCFCHQPLFYAVPYWQLCIFERQAVEVVHGGQVLFSMVVLLFIAVHEMCSLLLSVS